MTGVIETAGWNRFTSLPRIWAAAVLALLAALMIYGVATGMGGASEARVETAKPTSMRAEGMIGDHALYARVLHRVEAGEPYYAAAAAEHRANDYPLRPFMTMRLPTLAWILSITGLQGGVVLMVALAFATVVAWRRRLMSEAELPNYTRFAALLIAANLSQVALAQWVLMHEVVTGVLIALALALYRPERPWAAMAVVAVGLAIRETMLPVAMLFGLFALIDRDWRAAGAWMALGMAFLVGIAAHAAALAAVTSPADLASPGWHGMGGWPSYLSFIHATSAIRFLPGWITALLVPLALFGWASWRSRLGLAVLGVQLGYALLLMLFARANNFYWGLLVVPTLYIGLIFAPAGLAALVRSVWQSRLSVRPAIT